jgi:uncharacterized membrane protein YebE (DUF533 family)
MEQEVIFTMNQDTQSNQTGYATIDNTFQADTRSESGRISREAMVTLAAVGGLAALLFPNKEYVSEMLSQHPVAVIGATGLAAYGLGKIYNFFRGRTENQNE